MKSLIVLLVLLAACSRPSEGLKAVPIDSPKVVAKPDPKDAEIADLKTRISNLEAQVGYLKQTSVENKEHDVVALPVYDGDYFEERDLVVKTISAEKIPDVICIEYSTGKKDCIDTMDITER
jgi:formyltetrahydrofolate synthetase